MDERGHPPRVGSVREMFCWSTEILVLKPNLHLQLANPGLIDLLTVILSSNPSSPATIHGRRQGEFCKASCGGDTASMQLRRNGNVENHAAANILVSYTFCAAYIGKLTKILVENVPSFISSSSGDIPIAVQISSVEQTEELKKQLKTLIETQEAIDSISERDRTGDS
ncbi:hypothetical protein ACJ73_06375 [Blastomyces percursus]|uniref:Uncharacterized protein n=1 Tax=Blastomyces percursus TaxID=1658174 RepID=A0A1J9Q178_9EURO|nr:hypothetical protein ACJ73_06375 [Blastomyces percursus]